MTVDATPSAAVSILGTGAWGTALAIALAKRHRVVLWGRDPALIADLSARRENARHFPGFSFPENLQATADFDAAIAHLASSPDALLIVATSVAGLRPTARRLRGMAIPHLVWLCKGFEEGSRSLPHAVLREELGADLPVGALSGPSFAQEVAQGLPCALTIASDSSALCERVVRTIHGQSIRVYSTDDVVGVEVGGAVKNVLAIATGIVDGLGLGANARAALVTRGLAEIARLGVALGGRGETFNGLTGMGDLILTCTGELSRNRRVGLGLAQGKALAEVERDIGHVAEGVRCAQEVRQLAALHGVDMPIVDAVVRVLFDGDAPQEMVKSLLSRDPRRE